MRGDLGKAERALETLEWVAAQATGEDDLDRAVRVEDRGFGDDFDARGSRVDAAMMGIDERGRGVVDREQLVTVGGVDIGDSSQSFDAHRRAEEIKADATAIANVIELHEWARSASATDPYRKKRARD